MNIYAVVIVTAMVFDFVVHTVADLLNVKALTGPTPDSVSALYTPDVLDRSQRYVREATRGTLVERTVLMSSVLFFWLIGGFDWIDSLVRTWFSNEVVRGLAYIGILALAYGAMSVPFEAHRTFGIETRFGFNRTTRATFVADLAKGLLLAAALGGVLVAGMLALFLYVPTRAWMLCWCAVVAFSLFVQWMGPALILPIFNRFEPMPDGQLREAILRYADSVRYPLENVYITDGSRRSTRANAYFTGLGRRRRIALFDTLTDNHSVPEIVAILAHEVGHHRLKHVPKGFVWGILHSGVALYLLHLVLGQAELYEALRVSSQSVYVGIVGFALLYSPVEGAMSVVTNYVSRRHEFAADRFALDTSPCPRCLVDVLKKLSVVNLTHPAPHWLYVILNYTHPPLAQRLEAIERHLQKPRAV